MINLLYDLFNLKFVTSEQQLNHKEFYFIHYALCDSCMHNPSKKYSFR